MLFTVVQTEAIRQIFARLTAVLGIRVVLYDVEDQLVAAFDLTQDSPYCRTLRQDPVFDAACVACDRLHLGQARTRRQPQVYQCHHGLLEGIIPLYGEDECYLGAIVFGQIRASGARPQQQTPGLKRLYKALPEYTTRDVENIKQYVRRERMVRARDMLSQGLSVKEVGLRLGFYDEFHFSKAFKAWHGVSPSQFGQE